MSLFSGVKTFIGWFEKEIIAFQKNAPTIETDIESGIKYATGVLGIIATQVTEGSTAANIISAAVQDLKVLSAVAYDAGVHPTLASGFQDVVTNLSGLETAAGVKNPSSVATVAKVISTLSAITQVVLAIVPVV